MLERSTKWGLGLLGLAASFGCASTVTQKSTGTNWVECETDDDCAFVGGARCSADKVCVDSSGAKIAKSALGSGDAGPNNTGGTMSRRDAGRGAGGAGAIEAGGAGGAIIDTGGVFGTGGAIVEAGTGGAIAETGGVFGTGGALDGGRASGGVAGASSCYSPGQNLDIAYEPGAVGCRCSASAPGFCEQGVALMCDNGRWQAVIDGPCMTCWTPDQPDLAAGIPSEGCACTTENETACMHTAREGYATALCTGGKWTRRLDMNACTCASDARCGYGSRCESGICAAARCDVDGMRYAVGTTDIADPVTCNNCSCQSDGTLACTAYPCPAAFCPSGTTRETACLECGPAGGCALTRTGCLPHCDTTADCTPAGPGTMCYSTSHVCGVGLCE